MHDLDYLVTLTRLGHFPTELSRQIAVEKGIIFVEGEERIRRQQAIDYLKRMEER